MRWEIVHDGDDDGDGGIDRNGILPKRIRGIVCPVLLIVSCLV